MGRVALPRDEIATGRRPIVAHVHGGPFDGTERVLFRAQGVKSWRVRRGRLRRRFGGPRYAWYELERAWQAEDGTDHGDYVYRGLKKIPVSREQY